MPSLGAAGGPGIYGDKVPLNKRNPDFNDVKEAFLQMMENGRSTYGDMCCFTLLAPRPILIFVFLS